MPDIQAIVGDTAVTVTGEVVAPGLAVIPAITEPGYVRPPKLPPQHALVHVPSGLSLSRITMCREHAVDTAARVAAVTDWTAETIPPATVTEARAVWRNWAARCVDVHAPGWWREP